MHVQNKRIVTFDCFAFFPLLIVKLKIILFSLIMNRRVNISQLSQNNDVLLVFCFLVGTQRLIEKLEREKNCNI